MFLKIDETLIGMGLTTADIPIPRVSALMRLKSQNRGGGGGGCPPPQKKKCKKPFPK